MTQGYERGKNATYHNPYPVDSFEYKRFQAAQDDKPDPNDAK